MRPPRRLLAALPAILTAAVMACGGRSSSPTTTPTVSAEASSAASPGGQPEIDLATQAALTTVWGVGAGDFRSDVPALTVGDFNDDDLQDIAAGARFADGAAGQDNGAVYVVFGSRQLPPAVDLAEGEQGLTIVGAAGGDNLGFSLATGDVNDDGRDDLLMGAPFAKPLAGRGELGAAYVVFGRRDLGGTLDIAGGQQDVTLIGPEASSYMADSLAAGDVNDDDVDDIIAGATFAQTRGGDGPPVQAGAVFTVFGSSSLAGTVDLTTSEADGAVYGEEEFDELGDAVASGDVNGDGTDDIIMVAEAADGPGNARATAAEVYVVYGSRRPKPVLEIGRGTPDVTVYGADDNDTLGLSVASGDINGDGRDDVVMGARSGDGPGNALDGAGEVIIVLGKEDLPAVIDLAKGEENANIYGNDPADLMGFGGVGDIDGDGNQEVLAGTGYGDGKANDRMDSGELYIIEGGQLKGALSAESSPRLATVYAARANDHLGTSAAVADLNGDGKPELIVVAEDADGPGGRTDAGAVYVLSP